MLMMSFFEIPNKMVRTWIKYHLAKWDIFCRPRDLLKVTKDFLGCGTFYDIKDDLQNRF
jgi:hypothetical protein